MNECKSLQSEAQLIGSMFLDPACIPQVLKIVGDSGYFEVLENRTLFDLLVELDTEGIVRPDLIIMENRLRERNMLAAVGGMDYMVNVVSSVASAANFALHARHVRNCCLERQLAAKSDSILQILSEPGTAAEKINTVTREMLELQEELKTSPDDNEQGLSRLIEDTIAGRRQILKTCWPMMDNQTRCFLPGTLTLLCGNPGASKSFMLLQLLSHFLDSGVRSAVLELEESCQYHALRALAQRTRQADLTDPDWMRAHPEAARNAYDENKTFLGKLTSAITAPDRQQTLPQIADWIWHKARQGCRFIAADPITAAQNQKRDIWSEHNDFLQRIKQTAVEYNCCILLVTHPVKRVSEADINQLAGSAAFGRFCQTALWLEYKEETTADIRTQVGTTSAHYNRILHILKARNAPGQGTRLACTFDGDNLRLKELGMIVRNKQHPAESA